MTMIATARGLPVLLLILLLGACETPSHQDLLDDARARFAAGDETGAMIQLKNLLRADPDNREGRLLRGEVALSLEDGAVAEKDFLRAEELGVERADIVVDLGEAMLLQNAFERVIAEIHSGTASDDQSRFEILLLRGNAYLGLGKPENASRAFREALALIPDSPDARVGLGRVALARDDVGDALTELARAVAAGSQLPRVWTANGEVQLAADNPVEARKSFERAAELKPVEELKRADFAVLNGLFQSHLALDEADEALAVANKALEVGEGHALAHYLLARHAMYEGDIETASTHVLRTLSMVPNHLGALILMGSISLEQGKLKDAENFLHRALAMDKDNSTVRLQLAQTMLRLNEGEESMSLLDPVMRELGEVPELLALAGRATAASKGRSEWLKYFEEAAAADPSDLTWQFELAQAYVAAGLPDKSIEVLQLIPDSVSTSDKRDLILVSALRRKGDHAAALDVADRLRAGRPDDRGIRLMQGQLQLAAGNLDAARDHLDAVLDEGRANIPALLTLGQVEIRAARLDEAERLFREAYIAQPDYLPTVTLLVALAQSRGQYDQATEWLEAARETNPNSVMPLVGLVSLYLRQGNVNRAYGLARKAVTLQPDDPRALVALGITQIKREEFRYAIDTLEDAAIEAPQSGMIQFELARAHHGAEQPSHARFAIQRAIELSPWRADYAVAAARLELSAGDAGNAAAIARGLIEERPDEVVGYVLLGQALTTQELYADAASAFAQAVEVGQNDIYVRQHYEALVKAGDADAHRVLADWLDVHPRDWRVRVVLSQAYHSNGDTTRAIEQYETVLQDSPDNAAVLNNLAWLYADKKPQRALELAETVHRLQPHVPTFSDTLGWLLVQQGELERGLSLLREAARHAPDDADIRYRLAAALAQTGEVDEARLLLAPLVNSGRSFDAETEARALLQTL